MIMAQSHITIHHLLKRTKRNRMTSFTNLIVALIVCLATVPVSALERSTELFLHADIE